MQLEPPSIPPTVQALLDEVRQQHLDAYAAYAEMVVYGALTGQAVLTRYDGERLAHIPVKIYEEGVRG